MAEIMKRCYKTSRERQRTSNEGPTESSLEVACNWLEWREEICSHWYERKGIVQAEGTVGFRAQVERHRFAGKSDFRYVVMNPQELVILQRGNRNEK